MTPLLLASGSAARLRLLRAAGLSVQAVPPRVDEEAAKAALLAEGASPRDLGDALAELKAGRVAARMAGSQPEALVLGADQVLALGSEVLSKPATPAEALDQLRALRGRTHALLSAAVLCREAERPGEPIWRHVAEARLTMRAVSDGYLEDYVGRLWDGIRHSVGAYLIEGEGVRLMERIEGDLFTIQGLPLLPLLSFLAVRGDIPS